MVFKCTLNASHRPYIYAFKDHQMTCILNRFCYFDPIWINISLFISCFVETRNYSIFSLAFIASLFRVTEENLVFETVYLNIVRSKNVNKI